MGAAHGVFTAPAEGTASDIRFTRSKDNSALFAILLGWDNGQKDVTLTSLSSDSIDLRDLNTIELINGEQGKYLPLTYRKDVGGLTIDLPERAFEELAYVLKLTFRGNIPSTDKIQ
jgi:alpha-L-fucosidase